MTPQTAMRQIVLMENGDRKKIKKVKICRSNDMWHIKMEEFESSHRSARAAAVTLSRLIGEW